MALAWNMAALMRIQKLPSFEETVYRRPKAQTPMTMKAHVQAIADAYGLRLRKRRRHGR